LNLVAIVRYFAAIATRRAKAVAAGVVRAAPVPEDAAAIKVLKSHVQAALFQEQASAVV
jgi:hypothetical protein